MKKLFTLIVFFIVAFATINAQKNVIYITVMNLTDGTADAAEQPVIDDITGLDGGSAYTVTLQEVSYLVEANKDALNAADLVIVGRSCNSGDVIPTLPVLAQVTSPVLYMSPWVARGDRGGLVATGGSANYVTGSEAPLQAVVTAEAAASPVFAGISEGTIEWWTGMYSLFDAEGTTTTNASLKVKTPNDEVLLVMYDANVLMDGSAGRTADGVRAYMGNGQDNADPANYFTFSDDAKTVFNNLVKYLADQVTAIDDVQTEAAKLTIVNYNGTVRISNAKLSDVSVYTLSGQLVNKPVVSNHTAEVTNLNKGVYLVKATVDSKAVTGKFIVQ
ncbi:T9SS type A sorting domain-containing protein [Saccharicrinis sp. FJH2]|uniref:T9SS type A sorting domain-containing protein n=1 Tax=Saccharicrinis sp. FJH65 TaxID=3344659 RepID=UPI0035F36880